MASDGVIVKITGLEELKAALKALPAKLRARAIRNALTAGGRVFRDEAKRLTPVLKVSTYGGASAIRRGIRKPGTLRQAIRVRTSKQTRRAGDVGVFVNVKPAKGAQRGARSPNDPYYWRWVEFGTRIKAGAQMLQTSGRTKMGQALERVKTTLKPAIEKLNRKGGAA